jgi:hypothetical protein
MPAAVPSDLCSAAGNQFKPMKHNKYPQPVKHVQSGNPNSDQAAGSDQNQADFVPAPDAVARKAYFTYVNEGSSPGHDVQHWLAAEAELVAERNRTRTHGFHNRT